MVGVVMRQPGALPVWLITEAIHHRRSGANDRPHTLLVKLLPLHKTRKRKGFAKPQPNIVSYLPIRTNNPCSRK
ncbi:hypothetical protein [Sporosarcina ureae]|uniref:hypothetical protein n=1 Tax=Sporosarcina ureae TaxID=1571 RepID=UPI0012F4E2BF|nr:hypothetical protein [Sporosarcina ureae]